MRGCPGGAASWTALIVALLLAPGVTAFPLSAQTEEGVKVAALNSLLSFVRWPPGEHQTGDVTIAVLGAGPLESALDVLEGRTVFGRPIRVVRYESLAEVGHPHILFIGAAASGRLREALVVARERSILTVGETADFTADGGAMSLRFPRGTLEITLNECAFQDAGLEASSRLSRLSELMCSGNAREGG